jgi:hypothetical protein
MEITERLIGIGIFAASIGLLIWAVRLIRQLADPFDFTKNREERNNDGSSF